MSKGRTQPPPEGDWVTTASSDTSDLPPPPPRETVETLGALGVVVDDTWAVPGDQSVTKEIELVAGVNPLLDDLFMYVLSALVADYHYRWANAARAAFVAARDGRLFPKRTVDIAAQRLIAEREQVFEQLGRMTQVQFDGASQMDNANTALSKASEQLESVVTAIRSVHGLNHSIDRTRNVILDHTVKCMEHEVKWLHAYRQFRYEYRELMLLLLISGVQSLQLCMHNEVHQPTVSLAGVCWQASRERTEQHGPGLQEADRQMASCRAEVDQILADVRAVVSDDFVSDYTRRLAMDVLNQPDTDPFALGRLRAVKDMLTVRLGTQREYDPAPMASQRQRQTVSDYEELYEHLANEESTRGRQALAEVDATRQVIRRQRAVEDALQRQGVPGSGAARKLHGNAPELDATARARLHQLLERTLHVYHNAQQRCRLFQDAYRRWEESLQKTRAPIEHQLHLLEQRSNTNLRAWQEGLQREYHEHVRQMVHAAMATMDGLRRERLRLKSAIVHMASMIPAGHDLRDHVIALHTALETQAAAAERRERLAQHQLDNDLVDSFTSEPWLQQALSQPVLELWQQLDE